MGGWLGPSLRSCWSCLNAFLSNDVIVFTVHSNLLIQFCEESPGMLCVPLRWYKTGPHFFHGGCHPGAQRLLLLTGVLGIPCYRPVDTWERSCHLQAVRNVIVSLLMMTGTCLFLGLPQHWGKSSLYDIQAKQQDFTILLVSLPVSPLFYHFPENWTENHPGKNQVWRLWSKSSL